MKTIFLILFIFPPVARAQAPRVSTSAPVAEQRPLLLDISKDSYSSRVGFDYSLRWDFSDLLSFRPGLGAIASGVRAITSWDITENTRVSYYGFRTNPWRLIITKEKRIAAAGESVRVSSCGVVAPEASGYHNRLRLSISPLVDDIKRNLDASLGEFLLRASLQKASPEWNKMGDVNRKSMVRDILALPVWDTPLPLVGETREGLEYLSRPGTQSTSSVRQLLNFSTQPAPTGH